MKNKRLNFSLKSKSFLLRVVSGHERLYVKPMRSIVFLVSLLSSAQVLAADWTHVTANHHASYYVDVGSIQAVENSVTFWEMGNLFGPIGEGIVSVKSFNQGDCKNFLLKTLKTSFHKEPMAGDSVEAQASDNSTWKKPPLNSASANILKFVCER